MNNIYTEIDTILSPPYIDESYEISELADFPTIAISVKEGVVFHTTDIPESETEYVMRRYNFREIMPIFEIDFTIVGYVVNGEFFLFAVFMGEEENEISPSRRASFIALYNSNPKAVKLRHVPVEKAVLSFPGAKRALENGSDHSQVVKYTIQSVVQLCAGISPMTKLPRKGLVFKSLSNDYKWKCYSECAMNMMGSV